MQTRLKMKNYCSIQDQSTHRQVVCSYRCHSSCFKPAKDGWQRSPLSSCSQGEASWCFLFWGTGDGPPALRISGLKDSCHLQSLFWIQPRRQGLLPRAPSSVLSHWPSHCLWLNMLNIQRKHPANRKNWHNYYLKHMNQDAWYFIR